MICGNCHNDHETVNQVRACYAAGGKFVAPSDESAPAVFHAPKPVSPVERFNALGAQLPPIESGRYAIEVDGVWKFYKVDRPAEGYWKGRTFVKALGSDTEYKLPFKSQLSVLESIVAADAEKALIEYGHRVGRCGVCGRTLTDPESISLGIGPICRAKW